MTTRRSIPGSGSRAAWVILAMCIACFLAWALGFTFGSRWERAHDNTRPRPARTVAAAAAGGTCTMTYPCSIYEDKAMHPNNPAPQKRKGKQ
jgi:hypothetical protein